MAEVVFLRSPVAHARIRGIEIPPQHRNRVFLARDIAFAKPIVAVAAAGGFKPSDYPALVADKVRFVGDLVAMCVAPTRAEAEDVAQSCTLDLEELPPVWDIEVALGGGATRVHDHWPDNIYSETRIATGDLAAVRAQAAVTVTKAAAHGAPCRRLARMPRRARPLRPPARRARGLQLDPVPARHPHHAGAVAGARGDQAAGDRARRRRRLRHQEQLSSRGDRRHRAGDEARQAAALDRGSARAPDRLAARARASLRR